MFTFTIKYKDKNGSINDFSISIKETTVELARIKVEKKFNEILPCCELLYIGG